LIPRALVAVLVAASIAGLWLASQGIRPDGAGDETPWLVVLPFENLGTPEEQYFADGITEELTARLAFIRGLYVKSRTSANAYRETDKTVQQIGEELGVDFVLEGAVRWETTEEGERRIRIPPQLIRVSDDRHLWQERYELELAGIFQVQSVIAERVALALDITLLEPERRLVRRQPTDNLQAYEYYLRGKAHELRAEERAAVSMYETAIELDSTFAEAHAALGVAIWRLGFFGARDVSGVRAKAALAKAEQLGPGLVETHLALGETHYRSRRYDSATVHLEFVRARQPSNSAAIAMIGWMQRRQGKWEESVAHIETALALDPKNHQWAGNLGHSLLLMRRYSEAERYLKRAIAMAPDTLPIVSGWLLFT
jgi:adenylate cyclase